VCERICLRPLFFSFGRPHLPSIHHIHVLMNARLADVRHLISILNALHIDSKKDRPVGCSVSSRGMKFRIQTASKDVFASTWMPATSFRQYSFDSPNSEETFDLPLSVFTQCLQVFGADASLAIQYDSGGGVLTLLLGEDRAVSECRIRTQSPSEDYDMSPSVVEPVGGTIDSIVMQPDVLREALLELQDEDLGSKVLLELFPMTDEDSTDFVMTLGVAAQATASQWHIPYSSDIFTNFDVHSVHK